MYLQGFQLFSGNLVLHLLSFVTLVKERVEKCPVSIERFIVSVAFAWLVHNSVT